MLQKETNTSGSLIFCRMLSVYFAFSFALLNDKLILTHTKILNIPI